MGIIQDTNRWRLTELPKSLILEQKEKGNVTLLDNWDEAQELCTILYHSLPPQMRPWTPGERKHKPMIQRR